MLKGDLADDQLGGAEYSVYCASACSNTDHFLHPQKQDQTETAGEMLLRLLRTKQLQDLSERRLFMNLTQTKPNQNGVIIGISGDVHFANRVTSIGITEGTAFQTVRNDRKTPVLVYLRETLIAVNREDAERIEVKTA